MRATGSPATHGVTLGYRDLADMDVCDMDIRRFAVDQLLEQDGARAARAPDAGERGFGIDLDAEDDSVKGCQQRLAPAVPVLVAGSVSRVQRCQVAVRSAVPPHHDAVGGERVRYVVLRAERVFGALESCRDGRMDRDRFDRVGLRGGWGGRRAQGQRQEDGRHGDGVERFPDHRFQYGTGGTEMAIKKRRFTAEFKGRVALEALQGRDSVEAIATRHELHPDQVSACGHATADRCTANCPISRPAQGDSIGRGFVRQNLPELADKWNKSGHYATIVFLGQHRRVK